MRAARLYSYGGPDSVVVEEVADAEAGPGEAVVDIAAAAVNFTDVLIMADRYQVSVPLPFTPGSEFAGTVRCVGDGVTAVAEGDRVRGVTFAGAFAERIAVSSTLLSTVASGVDFVSAAALGVTYRTAYHSLRSTARVRPGEWVVVLGAAGGVGSAALDIAGHLGCRTVAVVSTADKAAWCLARGASAAVQYTSEDLKTQVKEITGGGADVVIDPVGGALAEAALRAMRWGGRFVTVGYASGEIPRIPLNLVLLKGVTIHGFEFRSFGQHEPDAVARDESELAALVAGGLRPHVSTVHALDAVAAALNEVAERRSTGKVVIMTDGGRESPAAGADNDGERRPSTAAVSWPS